MESNNNNVDCFETKFIELTEANQKYIAGMTQAMLFAQEEKTDKSDAVHIQ